MKHEILYKCVVEQRAEALTDSAREKLAGALEVERESARHEFVSGAVLLEESDHLVAARVVRHVEQRAASVTNIDTAPAPEVFVDRAEILIQN